MVTAHLNAYIMLGGALLVAGIWVYGMIDCYKERLGFPWLPTIVTAVCICVLGVGAITLLQLPA